jgi:hypothetical protein
LHAKSFGDFVIRKSIELRHSDIPEIALGQSAEEHLTRFGELGCHVGRCRVAGDRVDTSSY